MGSTYPGEIASLNFLKVHPFCWLLWGGMCVRGHKKRKALKEVLCSRMSGFFLSFFFS